MLTMAKRQILPACCEYSHRLGKAVVAVAGAGVGAETQKKMLQRVCDLVAALEGAIDGLERATAQAAQTEGSETQAESYRNDVVPAMAALRQAADELETLVDARLWPLPSYAEMLFIR
jgi:glutamine synthetase